MPRRFKLLERDIQGTSIKWARKHGYVCIKLTMASRFGTSGWPDFLILGDERFAMFVEFKSESGKLTPKQEAQQKMLTALGFPVFTVDSVAKFHEALDHAMALHVARAARTAAGKLGIMREVKRGLRAMRR